MNSTSANFLSCKTILFSNVFRVTNAHFSSGSFKVQLSVPIRRRPKTTWTLLINDEDGVDDVDARNYLNIMFLKK